MRYFIRLLALLTFTISPKLIFPIADKRTSYGKKGAVNDYYKQ